MRTTTLFAATLAALGLLATGCPEFKNLETYCKDQTDCADGQTCVNHECKVCKQCNVVNACEDNGCGGVCETCLGSATCYQGRCCDRICTGKNCGPDGCGGTCGSCPSGQACNGGQCEGSCVPKCAGRVCGPDDCGGNCGTCSAALLCSENGQCCPQDCINNPRCDGVCKSPCGTCPTSGEVCGPSGTCSVCTPNCNGRQCGPDGCGGECGGCGPGEICDAPTGTCGCPPACAGAGCSSLCVGKCGTCPSPQVCNESGACKCHATCPTAVSLGSVCGSNYDTCTAAPCDCGPIASTGLWCGEPSTLSPTIPADAFCCIPPTRPCSADSDCCFGARCDKVPPTRCCLQVGSACSDDFFGFGDPCCSGTRCKSNTCQVN